MDNQEAIKITRALASGLDPENGAPLEDNTLCRRPQVVKALNRALGALVQLEQREREKPPNAGRYWSRAEVAQLCEEIRKSTDFHQIAKAHNRTVGSIVARLVKLGKIATPRTPPSESQQTLRDL